MTKLEATTLLEIYGRAWVTQDLELIVTIFTNDATYHDPKEQKNFGRDAIRSYWETKVVGEQSDISFLLRHVWVDSDTVLAEWDAKFIDTKRNLNIRMTEVAIFTVQNDKFSALREYYSSEKSPR